MIRHVTDYARLSYSWIEDNGRDECWLRLPTGRDSVLYTDKKPMPEDSRVQELIQAHYAVRREWSKAHAACGKLPDNVPGLGGPPFSASREVYNDWSERCDAHKDACKQTERRLWAEIKAAQIAVEDELAKLMPLPE